MWPASAARERISEQASATKLKSKGEIGSPCLRPCPLAKKGPTTPLTETAVCPPHTKCIILCTYPPSKPLAIRTDLRKDQLTKSYAFSKSSLRITVFARERLRS